MTDAALAIAIPFVAQFEQFVAAAYHGAADRPGVWSIGYGFTFLAHGSAVRADSPPMTLDQANERLGELLAALLASIRRAVAVPITDHMAAALASFAYNVGFPALERSTLLACLNAGELARAVACFGAWDMANGIVVGGLVRRRMAEKALAMTPDAADPRLPPQSAPVVEDTADALMDKFNPEVPA